MKVLVLHGFGSSGTASTTCKAFKRLFGDDAVTPSYPSSDAHLTFDLFENTIFPELESSDTINIVGASLGGFWGRFISNKFADKKNVKLVMINAPTEH